MGYNLPIALITACACSWAVCAAAATDGRVGSTSQGSLQISLNVSPQVRLSNLEDVRLDTEGFQPAQAQSKICIYSRTGHYQLQAQGSGPDGSFALGQTKLGAATSQWLYQVRYDDGSGPQALTSGVPLSGLSGADATSQTCGTTGLNGRLQVSEVSGQPNPQQHQRTGHYLGTLTLLVAPE